MTAHSRIFFGDLKRQLLTWPPVIFILGSYLCAIPSLKCDLLLGLKMMGVTSIIRLDKIMTFFLLADSLLSSYLACVNICHVGETHVARK